VFQAKGYGPATVENVAAAAGLTPAQIAKHFEDKPALFAGLYDDFHAAVFNPPDPPADPNPDVTAQLHAIAERFVKAQRPHAVVLSLVLDVLADEAAADGMPALQTGMEASADALAAVVQAGQQSGMVLRSLDPRRVARDWLRFLFGHALLRAVLPADTTDEEHPGQIVDGLLHGVLKTDI
jgi:AcrR family transcriptional regulator